MSERQNPYTPSKGADDPTTCADQLDVRFPPWLRKTAAFAGVLASAIVKAVIVIGGAAIALLFAGVLGRGRQVRRFGRPRLPDLGPGSAWSSDGLEIGAVDDAPRAELAAAWRENGRTEHASVAAFSRLALDLIAVGAPPELIAAAHCDALDEVRHAEICFALARAFDGAATGPAPFPEVRALPLLAGPRPLRLARLAVDSLIDGALHEGASARIAAALAERCDDPTLRAVLAEIAADEGRHSAHGWEVVEWCLDEGGATVAHALSGAAHSLPSESRSEGPRPAAIGAWERWGIHGDALTREKLAESRAHAVDRVAALVGRVLEAA